MNLETKQNKKPVTKEKEPKTLKLRCNKCKTDLTRAELFDEGWVSVRCAKCSKSLFYNGA